MARAILKSMATVSGLTLVSRVLGFARQMLLAGIIGAGPVADAFQAAFRMPNMFRRLLAEGAFHAAFVPLFQGEAVRGDIAAARRFGEEILAWLIIILTILTALVMLFTPMFVSLLAWGFRDDPERFDLAVLYTRIMFPYLTCMSLVGIYAGMLNAMKRFAAAAAAPVLLNVCLIAGILLYADSPIQVTGLAAAWSVAISGALQALALVFAATRSKLLLRLRLPRFSAAAKRMVVLGAPGFIGAGALQINGIIGTNIASRADGAVSWLFYADQLYQLPLALVGIALGVTLMPAISRSVKEGDEGAAKTTLNRGIEIALFFGLPAAAALIAIPEFVCSALFQDLAGDFTQLIGAGKSAFKDGDVVNTGTALMIYGIGLPAFVMHKVLAAAFFAREDTRTPMKFALVAIAINTTLSISLFPILGFISVPTGTIIASWTEVSCLAVVLQRRGHLRISPRLASRVLRMGAVAAGLGGVLSMVIKNAATIRQFTAGQDWLLLIVIVAAGALFYGAFAVATRAVELRSLLKA